MSKLRDSKKKKKRKLEKMILSNDSRVDRDDVRYFALFAWLLFNTIRTCAYLFYAIASRAIAVNDVFPFKRFFLSVSPRTGNQKMVLNEQNSACGNQVVGAENLITKIHNMNWLKSSVIHDRNNCQEKMGRKNTKKPKSSEKNRTAQKNNSTSSNNPGPSNTAWTSNKNTAENLFPNSNAAGTLEVDEDEQLRIALEQSRISFENDNRMMANLATQDNDDTSNKSDSDDYWTRRQSNLPDVEPEKAAKPSDTNNNSSAKTVQKKTVAEIHNPPPGRSITARKCSNFGESVRKIEETNRNENKIESAGRGKVNMSKLETGNGRQHTTIGRGSRSNDTRSRMNQQKERSQGEFNSSNTGESEYCDSRRNEYKPQNNRGSTNSHDQSRGHSYNTGRESYRYDQYHYFKGQSQIERESDKRMSINNDKIEAISEKYSTSHESSKAQEFNRDVSNKNLCREEAPQLKILQNNKNSEASENASKKLERALRLQGFKSRVDGPPPDDEDLVPSTPKLEVSTVTSVLNNFAEKLEPPRSSTPMHNPPPGFAHTQPSYYQDKPASGHGATKPSLQQVYDRLAVYDPLLYRLLIQKQRDDYLLGTHRPDFESYENYQPEEEEQGAMLPLPTPEEQSYVYSPVIPPGYVMIPSPHNPEYSMVVHTNQLEMMNHFPENFYCLPSQPTTTIVESSLPSSVDFVDSRANAQMANENATPWGTSRFHHAPVQMTQAQIPMNFQPPLQEQFSEMPYDHLIAPNCSLVSNQVRATSTFPVPSGRQAFPLEKMVPGFTMAPPSLGRSIPRPSRPPGPFISHGRGPPPMKLLDEASNFGSEHFGHSYGNNEIPGNYEAPFNRDPRQHQIRSQAYPNVEQTRKRLQQQTR